MGRKKNVAPQHRPVIDEEITSRRRTPLRDDDNHEHVLVARQRTAGHPSASMALLQELQLPAEEAEEEVLANAKNAPHISTNHGTLRKKKEEGRVQFLVPPKTQGGNEQTEEFSAVQEEVKIYNTNNTSPMDEPTRIEVVMPHSKPNDIDDSTMTTNSPVSQMTLWQGRLEKSQLIVWTTPTKITMDGTDSSEATSTSNASMVTIQTPKGIETILSQFVGNVTTDDEANGENERLLDKNLSGNNIACIIRAVEVHLLHLCLCNYSNNDNKKEVHVHIGVTQRALDSCNATVLAGKSPPLQQRQNLLKSSTSPMALACQLRNALGALFPNTLLQDVASNVASDGGTHQHSDEVMTAKHVYGVMDNIHASSFESSSSSASFTLDVSSSSSSSSTATTNQVELTKNEAPQERQPLHIQGLVPKLRPYQEAAVRWMLAREQVDGFYNPNNPSERNHDMAWEMCWVVLMPFQSQTNDSNNMKHMCNKRMIAPLYQWRNEVMTASESLEGDSLLFYNPFAGWICTSYSAAKDATLGSAWNTRVPGGLLAESMGLGKTVETIACILANPCPTDYLTQNTAFLSARAAVEQDDEEGKGNDETAKSFCEESSDDTGNEEMMKDMLSATINAQKERGNEQMKWGRNTVDAAIPNVSSTRSDDGTLLLNDNEKGSTEISTEANHESPAHCVGTSDENCKKKTRTGSSPSMDSTQTILQHCGAFPCIFDRSAPFIKPLSWVLCVSCMEPMHGVCAGFESQEQLLSETRLMRSTCDKGTNVSHICDEDRCTCCIEKRSRGTDRPQMNLIPSRATLIVTPPSILVQWQREIQRHTAIYDNDAAGAGNNRGRPLKILVYPGIKELFSESHKRKELSHNEGNAANNPFQLAIPKYLADADVVLTTFQVLMTDLGHSKDNPYASGSPTRRLRKRKSYRIVPSPLTSIFWWRICLDEAQRVETTTAASSRMALYLESRFRWCVTGTPIGRGKVDDLYGLLLFLKLVPFADKRWFKHCLKLCDRGALVRLSVMLKEIFWRSTKANHSVRQQMGIPEQVENKIMLKFSSVERHFYQQQLGKTIVAADAVVRQKNSYRSNTKNEAMLSHHLHCLRAACCHPQVGSNHSFGRVKKNSSRSVGRSRLNGRDGASSVLTMDQILDRLIDDTKGKCEEAQRVVILHTNALASMAKLKVDAMRFGLLPLEQQIEEDLIRKSRTFYTQALDLAEENSSPTLVAGEGVLSGCSGFRSPRAIVQQGSAVVDWRVQPVAINNFQPLEVWAKVEFDLAKKLNEVRLRPIRTVPNELLSDSIQWHVLQPKLVTLQVSNNSILGFVDVGSYTLQEGSLTESTDDEWVGVISNFLAKKSSTWRIIVRTYHNTTQMEAQRGIDDADICLSKNIYVGLEVKFMEPNIAMDSLQKLHILHNLSSLLDESPQSLKRRSHLTSVTNIKISHPGYPERESIQAQIKRIEALYNEQSVLLQRESKRQLLEATHLREKCEAEVILIKKHIGESRGTIQGPMGDCWWDDLLALAHIHTTVHEQKSICDYVISDYSTFLSGTYLEMKDVRLAPFESIDGLNIALNLRFQKVNDDFGAADSSSPIDAVAGLSANPNEGELLENSQCKKCRAEWDMRGPICRLCCLEKNLRNYESKLTDPVTSCVLASLGRWVKDFSKNGRKNHPAMISTNLPDRVELFFKLQAAKKNEIKIAKLAWKANLELYSVLDELNQCKQSMRLSYPDENLMQLTDQERKFIVEPTDIAVLTMDYEAKQAMALSALRQQKDTLRYLKNQSIERREESMVMEKSQSNKEGASGQKPGKEGQICPLCLASFDGERAVLACGHVFHYSPCLESLMRRRSGHIIACPLRCTIKTKRDDVMIATDRRQDDGSRVMRDISGSWGTKVDRLVSDVMAVIERDEKGIIFSQWDDMLFILEEALAANKVDYVRPKSMKKIGEALSRFRFGNCPILLLNVKNGAEGLTLVEATNVFMMEPLLHCGLDLQAINRIHRIGQTHKTHVYRYIVEDTIEIKIDKLRMERQENHFEDDVEEQAKHGMKAGGIDGGLSEAELRDLLV